MSFLFEKNLNPHILLHALALSQTETADTALQRLGLLARTRKFDAIALATQQVANLSFPTLANSTILPNRTRNREG